MQNSLAVARTQDRWLLLGQAAELCSPWLNTPRCKRSCDTFSRANQERAQEQQQLSAAKWWQAAAGLKKRHVQHLQPKPAGLMHVAAGCCKVTGAACRNSIRMEGVLACVSGGQAVPTCTKGGRHARWCQALQGLWHELSQGRTHLHRAKLAELHHQVRFPAHAAALRILHQWEAAARAAGVVAVVASRASQQQ